MIDFCQTLQLYKEFRADPYVQESNVQESENMVYEYAKSLGTAAINHFKRPRSDSITSTDTTTVNTARVPQSTAAASSSSSSSSSSSLTTKMQRH